MRRFLRCAQMLTVSLAIGSSLAACGNKDQPDAPGANSGTRTTEHPAADMSRGDFNQRILRAIEKSGSARVSFEAGSGTQKSTGNGEVKYGKKMSMRMEMTPRGEATGGPQEVIVVNDTVYVAVGEKYMTMSMEAVEGRGMPNMAAALDPAVQAQAFDTATTSFKRDGPAETIDGVETIPYAVTVDPTKAPNVFGGMVTEPLTFVFHIGPDDLPRKVVYKDKNGAFVANYTDWGTPVEIEAPPAEELMSGPR